MPHYVDTVRMLSDPQKSGRLYYVLEPFIPKDWAPVGGGRYTKKRMQELYAEAQEKAQDNRLIGALESYNIAHKCLLDRLPELSDYNIIFTTGISVDLSEEFPMRLGRDLFNHNFRLSTEILNLVNELYEEYEDSSVLENYVFFTISPIVMPAQVCFNSSLEKPLFLEHPLAGIYERVNEILPERKRLAQMEFTKRLGEEHLGQKGKFAFTSKLFGEVKRKFDSDMPTDEQEKMKKLDEEHVYLNNQMLCRAYETVFETLGLTEIQVYAMRTSYVFSKVLKFLSSTYILKDIGGTEKGQGAMRNTRMSRFGECDSSALRILEGKINRDIQQSLEVEG